MDSSRAAWVRGGIRLISSASRKSVNSGPWCRENVLVARLKTLLPMISAGIRSDVHCTRLNSSANNWAMALITRVLAMPGTPSSKACPWQRTASRQCLINSGCPTITFFNSLRPWSRTRLAIIMRRFLLFFLGNKFHFVGVTAQPLHQIQHLGLGYLVGTQAGLDFVQRGFQVLVF